MPGLRARMWEVCVCVCVYRVTGGWDRWVKALQVRVAVEPVVSWFKECSSVLVRGDWRQACIP
jgi:hypothetical protein